MRIGVMSAGAVGGYLGARLAAAGHDVCFIARGAHLAAIEQHGLRVESPLGDLHLRGVRVTSDPREVGPVEIVLFAVKLWDTETAAIAAKPMVAPATRVVTLQNGVDSVELLRPILGADQVVGGTVHVATVIAAPGVVRHTSQFAQLRCGRSDRRADPALADFITAANAAGIDATLSDDIEADRWKKFVFLVALSGATGAMRLPLGPIRADPDARAFFVALMRETIAVGQAQGVALPSGFIEDRIGFADRAPYDFKASLLHDLEAGRRLELDWLAGKVTALGRTLGIATPANEAVYAVLKLHRNGHVA